MPAMFFRYGMEEHRGHGPLLQVDKPEARRMGGFYFPYARRESRPRVAHTRESTPSPKAR